MYSASIKYGVITLSLETSFHLEQFRTAIHQDTSHRVRIKAVPHAVSVGHAVSLAVGRIGGGGDRHEAAGAQQGQLALDYSAGTYTAQ